jgi:isoleucyl-tRNA synthetase
MFKDVNSKVSFPALEEDILKKWEAEGTKLKAIAKDGGKGSWVFYEGPPTANGKPGIHHVSSRAVKDLYCRFKTMQGYHVDRRGGWDTHGLPVEIEVEKEIQSRGKQDIEKFGVEKFNALCKESVFRYTQDWYKLTDRIAFWVDLDRSYVTYENDYIETEWWILKNFWDRGLLYEDYKTTMHCPRCDTSLADHEVSQGMKEDVDDPAVWVKFTLDRDMLMARGIIDASEKRPVSLMAWTTTPWTLGANVGMSISAHTTYALVAAPGQHKRETAPAELMIVAKPLAEEVFEGEEFEITRDIKPDELVGLHYEPVLRGVAPNDTNMENIYTVFIDPGVEVDTGTGIIHNASAYGDLEVGERHNLPVLFSAGQDGKMLSGLRFPEEAHGDGPYTGQFFKDADKQIIRDLKERGPLYRSARIKHATAHCWRDDTPLLHFAKTSWYIRTTAVKDKLLSNNQDINWFPGHVKDGRFGRWLENNIDWAISRERFWGCPLPIWKAEDGEAICVGSVAELSELTGKDQSDLDLHRPYVDDIVIEKDGKKYIREPQTIDVWFDSGAMPYAQWHYPFEEPEKFAERFPADFISEAMDQTRGWFYSLHAISTLLTYGGDEQTPAGPLANLVKNTSSFKNVVALGFINDAEGRKMSKSRGNTVDPWDVLGTEGCDPLRWYILSDNPPGTNLSFNRKDIQQSHLGFFLTLWNVYSFFVTYANIAKPDLAASQHISARPEIDRWLESKRHQLILDVTHALENFDAPAATRALSAFVDEHLSNWYVRRNRRRFWETEDPHDAGAAFRTLHDALLTVVKLMAPLAPFVSEEIYQNLASAGGDARDSVHLDDWPIADESLIDHSLNDAMDLVLRLVYLGRSARSGANVKLRQPLRQVFLRLAKDSDRQTLDRYADLIKEELNVKDLVVLDPSALEQYVDYALRPNFQTLGKRLGKQVPAFRKKIAEPEVLAATVDAILGKKPIAFEIDGASLDLDAEDFLLDVKGKEGFATAFGEGYLIALDSELDEGLIEEARLREFLRMAQDARRRADYKVSDRIAIGIGGDDAQAFINRHGATMKRDLLATSVSLGVMADADITDDADLDGVALSFGLKRG